MTGTLAKADALLSARVAPWLELTARKAPAGGEEAQPVLRAPRVDNDVLLPLRAGLQAQAGMQPRPALPGGGAAPAEPGGTALSGGARAILALADPRAGHAAPVRASAALWPTAAQAPAGQALALALSRQVSESGLFYESHLAEFASGARSLAQMQREPQAGLARGTDAQGHAPDRAEPQPSRQPAAVLSVAAAQAPATALQATPGSAMAALMPAVPTLPDEQSASEAPMPRTEQMKQPEAAVELRPVRQQGLHPVSMEFAMSRFGQPAADAQPHAAAPHPAMQGAAADMPAAAPAAVIHPQAAALVQQQLDLLAGAMFRWSGEAWPGAAMEWSVQEEGARRRGEEPADGQAQWSTTLSLELPRLGTVKVSLKLDGSSVHAQLSAEQGPTLERLRMRGDALAQRLSDAGLRLQVMQLGAEASA